MKVGTDLVGGTSVPHSPLPQSVNCTMEHYIISSIIKPIILVQLQPNMCQLLWAPFEIASFSIAVFVQSEICGHRRTDNMDAGMSVSLVHLMTLASCVICAWALLEYVNLIVWVRSVNKMLPSAECKVLAFLIFREKC